MVTFHNQRDFIFVRHHRYIYKQEEDTNLSNQRVALEVKQASTSKKNSKNHESNMKKERNLANRNKDLEEEEGGEKKPSIAMKTRARLQELGPRFTIKMKWLQEGLLDTQFGEYEWIHGKRAQMKTARKRFYL